MVLSKNDVFLARNKIEPFYVKMYIGERWDDEVCSVTSAGTIHCWIS